MRELQRRLEMPWGLFVFHLRVLVDAGVLKVRSEGRYSVVSLVGPRRPAIPTIPHPVSRAVYSALPHDGAAISSGQLGELLGLSRQLVDYHLAILARRELVSMRREGARKEAARKRSDAL